MKRPMPLLLLSILLLLCLFAQAGRAESAPIHVTKADPDNERLVKVWQQIENWDGSKIGKAGERGYFQFKEKTWNQVSDKPFSWASRTDKEAYAEQHEAAMKYVRFIRRALAIKGRRQTVITIALGWRVGVEASMKGDFSADVENYCARAANLYYDGTNR